MVTHPREQILFRAGLCIGLASRLLREGAVVNDRIADAVAELRETGEALRSLAGYAHECTGLDCPGCPDCVHS